MGAWGDGILQDDVALDVLVAFEDAMNAGMDAAVARRHILAHAPWSLDDADDATTAYLALAALQLQHKVLEPDIRDRTLAAIASGDAIGRWEGTAASG